MKSPFLRAGGFVALGMVLLTFLLAWGDRAQAAPPTAIGQTVVTNDSPVNVRSTPGGTVLGSQGSGVQGTTTDGPQTASVGGTSYTWWRVNFNSGTDGWVAAPYIDRVTSSGQANLIPENITFSPSSVVRGNSFNISFRIRNIGTASTGTGTTARMRLSLDTDLSSSDYGLTPLDVNINTLAAGASQQISNLSVTVPSSIPAGQYYVGVFADAGDDIPNQPTGDDEAVSSSRITVTAPAQPNLIAENVNFTPSSVVQGGSFTISYRIRNIGTGSTGVQTTARMRLSLDTNLTSSDYGLSPLDQTINVLGAGQYQDISRSVTVPSPTVPIGQYYVGVFADAGGVLNQTDVNDDDGVSSGRISVTGAPQPNLIAENVNFTPSSVAQGNSFTISYRIRNIGTGSTGVQTTARMRLSLDTNLTSSDYGLSPLDQTINVLGVGQYQDISRSVTVPSSTVPIGQYYVGVFADAGSVLNQSDVNDDDGVSAGRISVTGAPQPNLIAENVNFTPSSIAQGGSFTISYRIRNIGTASTGVQTTARMRLSTDTTLTSSDYGLSPLDQTINVLGIGQYQDISRSVTVPSSTVPIGQYYVGVFADASSVLNQSDVNDDDGVSVSRITITSAPKPNLIAENVNFSPSSIAQGGSFTISYRIRNIGTASTGVQTTARMRLSTDSTLTSSDYGLAPLDQTVNVLAAGQYQDISRSVTVPALLPVGLYYVGVFADAGSVLSQTDTNDDDGVSIGRINVTEVPRPNLIAENVGFSPASVVKGGSFTISYRIRNIGEATAGPTIARMRLTPDQTLTNADPGLNPLDESIPQLGVGQSKTVSKVVQVPTSVNAGQYYVGVFADAGFALVQTDETDDDGVSTSRLTVSEPASLPNLVPQSITLSKTTASPGTTLGVTWMLANRGTGNSPATVTGVRLNQSSTDGNAYPRTSFPNVNMSALMAGATTPQVTSVTIPIGTPPGTYYIWIIADNVTAANAIAQTSVADDYQRSAAITVSETTTGALSLALTSPTTGALWNTGESRPIQWSTSGSTQQVAYYRVHYSLNGGVGFTEIPPGQAITGNTVYWNIPVNHSSTTALIRVTAYNASGTALASANSGIFTLQTNAARPTALPDVNNNGPSVGSSITFTGARSYAPPGRSIVTYHWTMGDGSPVKMGQSVTHSYATMGTYYANLLVTDSEGLQDSKTLAITVVGNSMGTKNQSSLFADPVNLATGNFIFDAEDIQIPGMGLPLKFARFYNSKAPTGTGLPIGHHWTHTYNLYLLEGPSGDIAINFADGRQEYFTRLTNGTYRSEPFVFSTLRNTAPSAFTLTTKGQIRYNFVSNRLVSIQDRNGNTQNLEYDGSGRLIRVTDPSGRYLNLAYDASNRIMALTDPIGRIIQYGYDGNGDLVTVTDARGGVNRYSYDALHQMLTATDPNGNVFVTNEYDAQQRIVSAQRDALNNLTTFAYDFVTRLTTVTDPLGHQTLHLHDDKLRLIAQTNELGFTESYQYDEANNRTAVISRNGHATRYTYDIMGNVTSKTDALGRKTLIQYNALNDPIRRTDPLGGVTTFTYDVKGNLTRTTDAIGGLTDMTYSPAGKVLSIVNRNRRTMLNAYDSAGNLTRVTDALNGVTQMGYDQVGRTISKADPNNRVTLFTYDLNDNLVSTTDPLGHNVINTYDANGNRTRTRDARGAETNFVYDAKDRLIRATDALGGVTQYEYDSYDRKTKVIDARNNQTKLEYDAAGRLTATENALGQRVEHTHDRNGNILTTTDPLGHTVTFTYDAVDQVLTSADGLDQVTRFTYDALGRRTEVIDPAGRKTRSEFDKLNRLIKVTDPAGGIVQYGYDPEGNRTSSTSMGKVTLMVYDFLNRLIRREEPGGSKEHYSYDAAGNRRQRTDPKGQITQYEYDEVNRLIRVLYPTGSPVVFGYDPNGNRVSIHDGVGASGFTYDALNRMTRYTNPFGQTVDYEYDAVSNRTALIYPGAKRVEYTHDAANRMLTVKDWMLRVTSYTYDAAGRLIRSENPNGTEAEYTFDDANRLTSLANRGPGDEVISQYTYTLDPVGNHLSAEQEEPFDPTPILGNVAYTYDREDKLTSMGGVAQGHDANGNLTTAGSQATLTYDTENRLQRYQAPNSGDDWSWRFDGAGNRLEVNWGTSVQRFVLDVNTTLTQVLGVSDAQGAMQEYYVYGLGLVSKIDAAGTAMYYHYDSRGSTVATTGETGIQMAAFAYDPFGQVLGQTPFSARDRFMYLGKHGVVNDYNGFLYIRARHYSPERGRFLSKDPFLGVDDKSQTLNRFVYALNNPIRLIDISGFSSRETSGISQQSGTSDQQNGTLVHEVGRKKKIKDPERIKRALALQAATNDQIQYELEAGLQDIWGDYLQSVSGAVSALGVVATGGLSSASVSVGNALSLISGGANMLAGGLGVMGQEAGAAFFSMYAGITDLANWGVSVWNAGSAARTLGPAIQNAGIITKNIADIDGLSPVAGLYQDLLAPTVEQGFGFFGQFLPRPWEP